MKKISSKHREVVREDIVSAVDILSRDLGATFRILENTDIICCVPVGMNDDYKEVLRTMEVKFTKDEVMT